MRYISTTKNSPASIPAADNLENMTLSNHLQDNLDVCGPYCNHALTR
jgi:hypothetical protein